MIPVEGKGFASPEPDLRLGNSHVDVSPLHYPADAEELFAAASVTTNGEDIFQHSLGTGPFHHFSEFDEHLKKLEPTDRRRTYTVRSLRLGKLVGCCSLLDIDTQHGTVEIGSIWYSKEAQRTEVNTNAMFLIFSYVFETLYYRRLVWKCNNANEKSKAAALRLGFTFEGLFRQHFWDKGRNRDTAWYSIIDSDWPGVRDRFVNQLLAAPKTASRGR